MEKQKEMSILPSKAFSELVVGVLIWVWSKWPLLLPLFPTPLVKLGIKPAIWTGLLDHPVSTPASLKLSGCSSNTRLYVGTTGGCSDTGTTLDTIDIRALHPVSSGQDLCAWDHCRGKRCHREWWYPRCGNELAVSAVQPVGSSVLQVVTVSHFRAVQLSFEVTVTQEPPALCSEPDYIVGKALKSSHWVPNEANDNWDLSLCIVHRTLLFYIYNV